MDDTVINSETHTTEASDSNACSKKEVTEKDPDDAQERFKKLIGRADSIKGESGEHS